MQIPEFWSEAEVNSVRRWGWSDQSQAAADRHARERAELAQAAMQAGQDVPRSEPKLPYGGSGLPIREEVLVRNGNDVITRNRYGARCLNVPDVLIADVDLDTSLRASVQLASKLFYIVPITGMAMSFVATFQRAPGTAQLLIAASVALVIVMELIKFLVSLSARHVAACKRRMYDRIDNFIAKHPEAILAVYQTPAGLRVFALHQTFVATSPVVQAVFRELGADPAYAQMCALQDCFRARLTAKPDRIQLAPPPAQGVWPLSPDRLARRAAWVAEYEVRAQEFAACRFLKVVGSGNTNERCIEVQTMHDALSNARSDLPIA